MINMIDNGLSAHHKTISRDKFVRMAHATLRPTCALSLTSAPGSFFLTTVQQRAIIKIRRLGIGEQRMVN